MSHLFDQATALLKPVDSILDIGAGIRPQTMIDCHRNRHICVEPHIEYVAYLQENLYPVHHLPAVVALPQLGMFDTIFLLDVIEHMEKEEALEVIKLAKYHAKKQVVIFTPIGFYKQSYQEGDKDAWRMNGTYWQTHRSGWLPIEFPKWEIVKDDNFHPEGGAFFAIWNH